jgi:hypothetical protein
MKLLREAPTKMLAIRSIIIIPVTINNTAMKVGKCYRSSHKTAGVAIITKKTERSREDKTD